MQSNPFATRYFQPGAIRYEFFGQSSLEDLCERILNAPNRRSLIVGPHGSGKSTLIATLTEHMEATRPEQTVLSIRFSTDPTSRARLPSFRRSFVDNALAIIDGYEQLGMWTRWRVLSSLRKKSMRLLATAHVPIAGMETVWETKVDEASSKWVINKLLSNVEASKAIDDKPATGEEVLHAEAADQGKVAETAKQLFESQEWLRSRAKHGPNLRESLFDMYDWWQKNQR